MTEIDTVEALRALYGKPGERSVRKQMARLDRHARAFLEKSPFVLIGSFAPGRLPDVSPKGDAPGFTAVLDDRTVAIPDRPGNNRLDTFENIIANPMVGLLFLIPGMDETLRINGPAELRTDADLLARFVHDGRPPISVLVVRTDEVYLHCAKAFMRSRLWDPESRIDRKSMPTLGAMLKDQIGLEGDIAEIDRVMEERYRKTLY